MLGARFGARTIVLATGLQIRLRETMFTVLPQNMGYNLVDYDSERVNGQLTLQYDLTNDIRLTADYTMSEFRLPRAVTTLVYGSTTTVRQAFGRIRLAIPRNSFHTVKIGTRNMVRARLTCPWVRA